MRVIFRTHSYRNNRNAKQHKVDVNLTSVVSIVWKLHMKILPRKEIEQIILETISKHMKEKVTARSQHGFTQRKSCLTNLIAHNEMTG